MWEALEILAGLGWIAAAVIGVCLFVAPLAIWISAREILAEVKDIRGLIQAKLEGDLGAMAAKADPTPAVPPLPTPPAAPPIPPVETVPCPGCSAPIPETALVPGATLKCPKCGKEISVEGA